MKFIVTEKSQRPAQKDLGKCFYCHQPIGSEHKSDCVLIMKKVKVRMTIEYEVEVPADWSKEMVEFHRNESSWCAGNAIAELESLGDGNECLCGVATFECLDDNGEAYLSEK